MGWFFCAKNLQLQPLPRPFIFSLPNQTSFLDCCLCHGTFVAPGELTTVKSKAAPRRKRRHSIAHRQLRSKSSQQPAAPGHPNRRRPRRRGSLEAFVMGAEAELEFSTPGLSSVGHGRAASEKSWATTTVGGTDVDVTSNASHAR